jgi:multicomponent Na+:H+ antiporter subunit D
LAYSTISQISYIFCGLFLFTPEGRPAAFCTSAITHASSTLLFLAAGAVIFYTGKRQVPSCGIFGRQMPVTMVCFGWAPWRCRRSSRFPLYEQVEPDDGFPENRPSRFFLAHPVILLISALLTAGFFSPSS